MGLADGGRAGRGAGQRDGGEGGREDEERDEDFHEGHRSEGWRGRPGRVVQAGVCQVEAECALAHVAKHDEQEGVEHTHEKGVLT